MKTHRSLLQLGGLLALLGSLATASAQMSIDWFKVAGGGGTRTGATYQVSGTVGQPDAGGALTGGSYSLTGGFRSLYALQTAGAPTRFITHSGNTVTIYWQNTGSWTLQQNGNLASSSGWSASSGMTTNNGTNYLNVVNPSGNLFFRLK